LMEQAFDETYDNLPPAAGDFQRQVNENSLDQLASMIQESDELLMGMAADKKGKRLYMDLSFTGVKGSELAKSLTVSKGAKTAFSNFLEMKDAAMSMNFTQKATEKDVESTKGALAPFKDQIGKLLEQDSNFGDEDIDLVEGLVVAVMDALIATVDTGSIDMGGAVLIDDEGLNVVAAGRLTDAKKVEAEVKKIAKARGDRLPPQIDFELDAMTYKGVTFHTLSGSIPEANAQEVLGETTTLVVGIAAEKLYVGFGVDPIAKLKKAIDTKSSKAADHLGQVNMTLSPILRMASQASGEQMLADMADQLEDEGNQMIRMTSDVIENGQKTRFELQEGILSLIQMGASGLGGGFGGDF